MVCKRWCVTKWRVKDCVCVSKLCVCDKVADDKVVCERWCVTKWRYKVVCERWNVCVCVKVVCERWCLIDGV